MCEARPWLGRRVPTAVATKRKRAEKRAEVRAHELSGGGSETRIN